MSRTGLWVAAAGGVTLLGGVASGFVAKGREQDAWAACRGSGGRPECPESARADFSAAETFATVTNVLMIGGGLLSVTGLGLVIAGAESRAPANRTKLELAPALGLDGASVAVTGAF